MDGGFGVEVPRIGMARGGLSYVGGPTNSGGRQPLLHRLRLPTVAIRYSTSKRFHSSRFASHCALCSLNCRLQSSFILHLISFVTSFSIALCFASASLACFCASIRSHLSLYVADVKILDLKKSNRGCWHFLFLTRMILESARNLFILSMCSFYKCTWKLDQWAQFSHLSHTYSCHH